MLANEIIQSSSVVLGQKLTLIKINTHIKKNPNYVFLTKALAPWTHSDFVISLPGEVEDTVLMTVTNKSCITSTAT